ncbi:hypothetical protein B0H10DRAFT_1953458 [Mycena sp. CBHHK59/15]|nr:hypothetical protein B0H10DRAFT_1953458 [Mycena sp. CBHHK59/15]
MESTGEAPPSQSGATRKCRKPWCKIMLDIDDKKKNCAKCRALDTNNQRAKKARTTATSTTTSRKRRRASVGSADGRPTTRPRTDQSLDKEAAGTGGFNDDEYTGGGSDDEIAGGEEDNDEAAETFSDAESFFEGLRTEFKAGDVDFHGTYAVAVDPLVTPKERVQMVATEIWKISGHRFTCKKLTGRSVKDHRKLKSGHRTRFWCSQDEARKKKSKSSQNPDVSNRDNVGMKRYTCQSKLAISCRTSRDNDDELNVTVQLKHAGKHINYTDVSMPQGALDMIRENVEWLTPVVMVSKVQATFPAVTAAQIHRAWMEMSEIFWRRDDLQLPSAAKLLEEHGDNVDIFKPEDIPEGVEMLCWGMKKVAGLLKGKIVEIGVDATCACERRNYE